MSDALVSAVAARLQAIPHARGCASVFVEPVIGGGEDYAHNMIDPGPCDCDREQRVAEAVARAIEAAIAAQERDAYADVSMRDAALRALGSADVGLGTLGER